VRDPSVVDRQRLAALDTAWVSADTFHIVVGEAAQRYAAKLATRMPQSGGATPLPA
jgi:PTS system N-acetylglucosamine-specific IIC component